ncbi:putative mannitol dehydrogenase [Morella rubra]|uniref:Putative mannitol dehydrogenase n=1 Tax=Morella rubra TaxID=262757 RepID=A0A6A1UNX2_9ROSI|nr:putative mannitol dehydrogenase [Morella rubra]
MQAAMNTVDGIIDTVSAVHPILPLLNLLKSHRKLVLVGAPEKPLELPVFPLLSAKHNITADIEVISMEYVNTATERLAKGDVRYRFVIDVGNTLAVTKP